MSNDEARSPTTDADADPMGALEALYRAEYQKAADLALLLTGNRAVAEELAQDAFVRVAPRVAEVDNPGGYLRTTLVNLCRDQVRRRMTADRRISSPPVPAPAPGLPDDVSEVWVAMQQLPVDRRDALILRYWLDLPTAEIARLLGMAHPTVRSHIRRGLTSLRKVLSDES